MKKPPGWLKPATDYGPLVVFVVAYEVKGLMAATAALMAATLVALALSLSIARKVPLMPVLTAVVVGIFGGLTLWLKDDTFIKLKPTIIYLLFAALLAGGLLFKKPLLKAVIGDAFPLDDDGWRRLSLRFAMFFLLMAGANEVIRRVLPTDWWVLWKVGGSIVLTFVFMLTQMGLIRRHSLADATPKE